MKAFWKRLAAVVMVICLAAAVELPADTALAASGAAKKYVDLAGQYQKELEYVINNGLMSNSGNQIFPEQKLTKGAASLSLNALLGAVEPFADMAEVPNLKRGDQYYLTVSRGLNAGYLKQKADGSVYSPKAAATYKYLADIFSAVLGVDGEAMSQRILGMMPGKKPSDGLTRGEFAYILSNLAPNIIRQSARVNGTLEGDVYVVKPGIVLTSLVVTGNLVIADGVGDGEVTLNNAEIGNLVVRGGGENSILIRGKSKIKDVVMKQVNTNTAVKVQGVGAVVEKLTVLTNKGHTNIQGRVNNVVVAEKNTTVVLENAVTAILQIAPEAVGTVIEVLQTIIEILTVEAPDSHMDLKAGTAVKVVEVKEEAKGTEVIVEEEAVIETVTVAAEDVAVTGEGTVEQAIVTEDSNVEIAVANEVPVEEVEEIPVVIPEVAPTPTPTPEPTATPVPTQTPAATPSISGISVSNNIVAEGEEISITVNGSNLDSTVSVQVSGGAAATFVSGTASARVYKASISTEGSYTVTAGSASASVKVLSSSVFKRTADYTVTLSYVLGVTIVDIKADRSYVVTEIGNSTNTSTAKARPTAGDYIAGLIGKLTVDEIEIK